MSTYRALERAERLRQARRQEQEGPRPYRVVTVASNKGGVGKTTIATNLAIYLRAVCENLPVLLLSLDDQPVLDRMFGAEGEGPKETIVDAIRAGTFGSAVRLGQYGVHYVPTDREAGALKQELRSPFALREILAASAWEGLVVIDTKSDLEILSQNAIAASDLATVVVKDQISLLEARRVFELLQAWDMPRDTARILLSLVDLRVKFQDADRRDVLALMLAGIRRFGYPQFATFVSRSPKIESLATNPEGRQQAILHGAPGSLVHRQFRQLALDVLDTLDIAKDGTLR